MDDQASVAGPNDLRDRDLEHGRDDEFRCVFFNGAQHGFVTCGQDDRNGMTLLFELNQKPLAEAVVRRRDEQDLHRTGACVALKTCSFMCVLPNCLDDSRWESRLGAHCVMQIRTRTWICGGATWFSAVCRIFDNLGYSSTTALELFPAKSRPIWPRTTRPHADFSPSISLSLRKNAARSLQQQRSVAITLLALA